MTSPTVPITTKTLKRGGEETKTFLVSAYQGQSHHTVLRQEGLEYVAALNAYRATVMGLQTQIQAAEIAETDAELSGKFYEMADILKTSDRLTNDVVQAIRTLSLHLARAEAVHADVARIVVVP